MPHLDWYVRAQLKLRHLQLLVALDDYRSAARVAAHLHVTQPAVSKMLAAIEKGVEAPLFERTARGLEPTEYGVVLVRHAREIMESLGNAHAEFQDIGEGRLTRVALGVLPSTAVFLIPRLVAALEGEANATGVAISVREGTMEFLLPLLRTGQIDLAVGFLPAKRPGSEYKTTQLYEDPTVTVVRNGHPLSKLRKINWKHLSDYPMILPVKGSLVRSAIDSFMAEHQVHVARRHLESVSTLANLGVLQLTDSIGFMQEHLARYFVNRNDLSILRLDLPSVTMRVGLIWMAERQVPPATRRVMDLLELYAKELSASS
ncbi:LysR family transcriptional regulator [Variovorax guangxiensis]|uniref:LysR family transcriptional regulator n=1 Tax=Variovorax guangxiensis TaxID=1775474 RepID=A0A433MU13_9BURK|nr:LysR substrate-binding domain-containing protein [Variovorax guangxiensis]RUR71269.1 LysR family transcriptional regulator [Variovorax guangxiensis]